LRGGQSKIRAIIAGIVSFEILLLIAFIIIQAIAGSVTRTGWSTTANDTWTALQNYIWIGFGLLAVVPLVLVAAYMIGILNFGGGKGA
jgi:nitrogen fixation/metabolism regulation signal transduction histidine kinase